MHRRIFRKSGATLSCGKVATLSRWHTGVKRGFWVCLRITSIQQNVTLEKLGSGEVNWMFLPNIWSDSEASTQINPLLRYDSSDGTPGARLSNARAQNPSPASKTALGYAVAVYRAEKKAGPHFRSQTSNVNIAKRRDACKRSRTGYTPVPTLWEGSRDRGSHPSTMYADSKM